MTVDMPLVFVSLMLTAALLFTLFGIRRELMSNNEGFVKYIVYGPRWFGSGRRRWWWRHYRP